MIAYISKRLNRRYLNKLRAGVLFAYIPKALFLYFTIGCFFFFFFFSLDKDSSIPLFSCDILYCDWICQIASVTFDYIIPCQETMKNKVCFYFFTEKSRIHGPLDFLHKYSHSHK